MFIMWLTSIIADHQFKTTSRVSTRTQIICASVTTTKSESCKSVCQKTPVSSQDSTRASEFLLICLTIDRHGSQMIQSWWNEFHPLWAETRWGLTNYWAFNYLKHNRCDSWLSPLRGKWKSKCPKHSFRSLIIRTPSFFKSKRTYDFKQTVCIPPYFNNTPHGRAGCQATYDSDPDDLACLLLFRARSLSPCVRPFLSSSSLYCRTKTPWQGVDGEVPLFVLTLKIMQQAERLQTYQFHFFYFGSLVLVAPINGDVVDSREDSGYRHLTILPLTQHLLPEIISLGPQTVLLSAAQNDDDVCYPTSTTAISRNWQYTYSSTKFCWGPMMEPGRQIRIQAITSAAVRP